MGAVDPRQHAAVSASSGPQAFMDTLGCKSLHANANPALSLDHAGGHVGLHGDALWPTASSLAGKRARGPDANDMDFIEDDEVGGDGDWRAMLRAVTGGYDPSKCASMLPQVQPCGLS